MSNYIITTMNITHEIYITVDHDSCYNDIVRVQSYLPHAPVVAQQGGIIHA